jgi:hypothetical protein
MDISQFALTEDQTQWIAERLRANRACLEQMRAYLAASGADPFGRPPVDLRVTPGLVRPGEPVEIHLHAATEALADGRVEVQADYLGATPGARTEVTPAWQSGPGGWEARITLEPRQTGNWRVIWTAGEERLSRVFGVVEPGQVVVTLWVGSNRPQLDAEIHQYDLPGDTWVDLDSPFTEKPATVLESLRPWALTARRSGDRLTPWVNAGFLLPGWPNSNLFLLPEAVQREGLQQLQELWGMLGLPEIEVVASYTPGHRTVAVLQDLGFLVLNSLCVWQNTRDGDNDNAWLINHMGAPNAPYYAAEDDFRKVAPERGPLVACSMGSTSNVRMYDFITFDGCPSISSPSQRYAGNNATAANVDRFFTVVDGWLHDARNNAEPVCVTVPLENFAASESWRQANAQAVDYLVRRAREGRVVFASAADIAAFYQRHYPVQPEQILFQHDCYCGTRHENKPACLPDRIEVSNARFHALFTEGQALPQLLWDFTAPWNNPEWTDALPVRNPQGTILPEAIAATKNPAGSVPIQADLRGVQARVSVTPTADGALVAVEVETPRALADLPLGLWHLPLAEGELVEAPAGVGWRPIQDGWTGNCHGVLILENVPAGTASYAVRLRGEARAPQSLRFTLSGGVVGRTFRTAEGPLTYLWREDGVGPCTVFATAPPEAAVHYNDGTLAERGADGRLEIVFDDTWERESPCLIGGTPAQVGGTVRFAPVVKSLASRA